MDYIYQPSVADTTKMFKPLHANSWLEQASKRPDPKSLWGELWYEGEVSCLFADTNVGKSIYAVQIADAIGRSQPVLYFDFEMSDKQFQLRYTDPATGSRHRFSDGFIRVEFSQENAVSDDIRDIVDGIGRLARDCGSRVVIIDNLTWLCNQAENGEAAGMLMQLLVAMKRSQSLSVLVLAHTPKRNTSSPLTQNSLAGSKRLANFFDSMFAIGVNKEDVVSGRYIKQIKVRNGRMTNGSDNVVTTVIGRQGAFLGFEPDGFARESEMLDDSSDPSGSLRRHEDRLATERRIRECLCMGMTIREISDRLRVSPKTVVKARQQLDSQQQSLDIDCPADNDVKTLM